MLDAQDLEAVRLVALGRVFALRLRRHRVERDVVRIVDDDQVVEAQVARQRRGFGRDALLHAPVAGQAPDRLVEDARAGVVEPRRQHLGRDCLPDRVADALAERARGRLDAGGVMKLRVPRRLRFPLAKVPDVVERERIAREVQPAVEKHAAVPRREDEAVATEPLRIAGVVAKEVAVEDGADLGVTQRQSDVSGSGGADGVHRESAGNRGGGGKLLEIGHDGSPSRRGNGTDRKRTRAMLGALWLLCYSAFANPMPSIARTKRHGRRRRWAAAAVSWGAVFSALSILGCSAADGGSGSSGELGDACQGSSDCLSGVCLPFSTNYEGLSGVCSSSCGTSADCASGGACLPDPTGTVADACWARCTSASNCGSGVACIWDSDANGGVCAAVSVNICNDLLGANGCTSCIANNCCPEYAACIGDVTCGKDYAGCTGATSCASKFSSSSDSAESQLGSCMGSSCGGYCP